MKHVLLATFPLVIAACHGSVLGGNLQPAVGGEIYAAEMDRLCSENQAAYEYGYNAGLEREPMNSSWVRTTCVPERHADITESYLSGYNDGVARAPAVVAAPAAAPAGPARSSNASTIVTTCTFDSDCGGEGYSCRTWGEHNTSVCMGFGGKGDPCWFDSDCLSDECGTQDERVCE